MQDGLEDKLKVLRECGFLEDPPLSAPRSSPKQTEKKSAGPLLIKAADVVYEPPRWLISPYFQKGKGTLVQGDNGTGKTAFMCAIAAHVSNGKPLLGIPVKTPGNVLLLSVEDDLPVLRGRIEACGGVPALLVECKTCNNEVPEEEVSDEGLCQECQQEVLKRFQHYMAGLQPEERAYLNHVFDGEAF